MTTCPLELGIEGRLPSWNTFYSGVNHRTRTAIKDEWCVRVRSALTGEETPFDVPVHITVYAEYRGVPVDCDNVVAKLVIDGLKHAHVLHDDMPRWVSGVTCHSGNSKRNYVTIIIQPQGE